MTSFAYMPLSSPDDIRLVHVDHVNDDGALNCALLHVNRYKLSPGLRFVALSYRWGDATDQAPLKLRNASSFEDSEPDEYKTLLLPRSALEILGDMYNNDWLVNAWFWLDSVCLNQGNVSEKNIQVKAMGKIYELAEKVLVYAGPTSYTTAAGIEFFHRLQRSFEELPDRDSNGDRIHQSYDELLLSTGTTWSSPEWIALRQLFDCPWFGRLWTIQEIVLAVNVAFVWGAHSLSWDELALIAEWDWRSHFSMLLQGHGAVGLRLRTFVKTLKALVYLKQNRAGISKGWRCTLHGAIASCDGARASDPRDQIYGLLGLLFGEDSDVGIKPNYHARNTVQAVYTDETRRLTQQMDSFDIIYAAGIGWPRMVKDLPSWLPDFSRELNGFPGWHLKAGKGIVSATILPLKFDGGDFHLQVYIVDTLWIVQNFAHAPRAADNTANVTEDAYTTWYLSSAIQLGTSGRPKPWTLEYFEAFWRTLTFNSIVNEEHAEGGRPSPPKYGDTLARLQVVAETGILPLSCKDPELQVQQQEKERLLTTIIGSSYGRALGMTQRKQPILSPRGSLSDDVVAVAIGARVPFVLRATGESEAGIKVCRLVGTAYVHELDAGIHVAAARSPLEIVILR